MEEEKKGKIPREITINNKTYRFVEPQTESLIDKGYLAKGWNYIIDYDTSPTLKKLFDHLKLTLTTNESNEEMALRTLFNTVSEAFPKRSINKVRSYAHMIKEVKSGEPVSLEDYAREGIGNCSQTTLTTVLLGQKLKEQGLVFLNRNFSFDEAHWENDFTAGGHFWGKYRSNSGKEFIIDIVRNYLGNPEGYKEELKKVELETLNDF